jgi:hypothetical protein
MELIKNNAPIDELAANQKWLILPLSLEPQLAFWL